MIHRKFRGLLTLILSVSLILVTNACDKPNTQTSNNDIGLSSGHASWGRSYKSLYEITVAPEIDLIVVGKVARIAEILNISPSSDAPMYVTRWVFRVETTLKGKTGQEILVNQTGSPEKPSSAIREDPLFEIEHKYLLFLMQTEEAITAYSDPGPWGRFEIINGKTYSANNIAVSSGYVAPQELDYNGVELAAVTGSIADILNQTTQLAFHDVITLAPGRNQTIEVEFLPGKYGPGIVTLDLVNISNSDGLEIPMPEGLEVSIEPEEFTALTGGSYNAMLYVKTAPDISPGTYRILLHYKYADFISGQRQISVIVVS